MTSIEDDNSNALRNSTLVDRLALEQTALLQPRHRHIRPSSRTINPQSLPPPPQQQQPLPPQENDDSNFRLEETLTIAPELPKSILRASPKYTTTQSTIRMAPTNAPPTAVVPTRNQAASLDDVHDHLNNSTNVDNVDNVDDDRMDRSNSNLINCNSADEQLPPVVVVQERVIEKQSSRRRRRHHPATLTHPSTGIHVNTTSCNPTDSCNNRSVEGYVPRYYHHHRDHHSPPSMLPYGSPHVTIPTTTNSNHHDDSDTNVVMGMNHELQNHATTSSSDDHVQHHEREDDMYDQLHEKEDHIEDDASLPPLIFNSLYDMMEMAGSLPSSTTTSQPTSTMKSTTATSATTNNCDRPRVVEVRHQGQNCPVDCCCPQTMYVDVRVHIYIHCKYYMCKYRKRDV
jgi:hypothetical protein